jgi:hypothetical protein
VRERPRPSPRALGRRQNAGATLQPVRHSRLPGCSRQGRSTALPLRFQPVTAPGFGILSDSLVVSRQGGLRTRPYPDPPFPIPHSPFAIRLRLVSSLATRHSLLAIFHHSPFAIRHSPYFSARRSLLAIFHHSPFAIRNSRFAVSHHSPLATRCSPYFTIRHSLFAVLPCSPGAVGVPESRVASEETRVTNRRRKTGVCPRIGGGRALRESPELEREASEWRWSSGRAAPPVSLGGRCLVSRASQSHQPRALLAVSPSINESRGWRRTKR